MELERGCEWQFCRLLRGCQAQPHSLPTRCSHPSDSAVLPEPSPGNSSDLSS